MEKFNKKDVQGSTEQQCDNSESKSLGYKIGEVVGATLCLCATAVVVALTTKFIFWLF